MKTTKKKAAKTSTSKKSPTTKSPAKQSSTRKSPAKKASARKKAPKRPGTTLADFEKALENLAPKFRVERGPGLSEDDLAAFERALAMKIPKDYRAFLTALGSLRIWTDKGDALVFFGRSIKVNGADVDLPRAVRRCERELEELVDDYDFEDRAREHFLAPLENQPAIPFAMRRNTWSDLAALNAKGAVVTLDSGKLHGWTASFWEQAIGMVENVSDAGIEAPSSGEGEEDDAHEDDAPVEGDSAIGALRGLLEEPPSAASVRIGKGMSAREIVAIEKSLGLSIPAHYQEFLKAFGFVHVSVTNDKETGNDLTLFGSPFDRGGKVVDLLSAFGRYESFSKATLASLRKPTQAKILRKLGGALLPFLPFARRDDADEDWEYVEVLGQDGRLYAFGMNEIEKKPVDETMWTSMLAAVRIVFELARLDRSDLERMRARHAAWLAAEPDAKHSWSIYALDDENGFAIYRGNANPGQAKFAGKDVRHLTFAGVDLRAANAYSVIADGVDFSKAKLADACMVQMRGANARFDGADLARVDFSRAKLAGASFKNADCSGADFERADLTGCDFTGAKLEGIKTPRTIHPPTAS